MFAPPTADFQGPTAPPASMFDNMPGYEGTVAGGGGTVQSRAGTSGRIDSFSESI